MGSENGKIKGFVEVVGIIWAGSVGCAQIQSTWAGFPTEENKVRAS